MNHLPQTIYITGTRVALHIYDAYTTYDILHPYEQGAICERRHVVLPAAVVNVVVTKGFVSILCASNQVVTLAWNKTQQAFRVNVRSFYIKEKLTHNERQLSGKTEMYTPGKVQWVKKVCA